MEVMTYIAMVIVSYILSSALTPKPKTEPPATLKDFEFPQVAEGTPQMIVFGDVWIEGWTVLGYGDLKVTEIR